MTPSSLLVLLVTTLALAISSCIKTSPDGDGEPGSGGGNDGAAQLGCRPIDVRLLESYRGELGSKETDCYSFEVATPGTLEVKLEDVSAGLVYLEISQQPESGSPTAGDVIIGGNQDDWRAGVGGNLGRTIPLPPGAYLIKVGGGPAAYQLSASFQATLAAAPTPAPGDTIETAAELGYEDSFSGYVGKADVLQGIDFDLYVTTLRDAGTLELKLEEVSAGLVYIAVASAPEMGAPTSDAVIVGGNQDDWRIGPGGSISQKVPLPPGTYVVKVGGGPATYQLSASFKPIQAVAPERAPGDTVETAASLSDGDVVGGYVGKADALQGTDFDLYAVKMQEAGTVELKLEEVSAGLVYLSVAIAPDLGGPSSDDVVIGGNQDDWRIGPGGSISKKIPLPAGEYVVQVGGGPATYQLSASIQPIESMSPDPAPGDTVETAAAMEDGDVFGGYVGKADRLRGIDFDLYDLGELSEGEGVRVTLDEVSAGSVYVRLWETPRSGAPTVPVEGGNQDDWRAGPTGQVIQTIRVKNGSFTLQVGGGDATYRIQIELLPPESVDG